MAKYVGVPTPILASSTATGPAKVVYTNSGTTTAAAGGKLTDTGGTPNFTTNVVVGDYVLVNETGIAGYPIRSWAKVTAVDSDSVLSISGPGASGTAGLSASGTDYAIVTAANVRKADLSGGGFLANVKAGDMLVNTTTNLNTLVTKVVSDTQLEMSAPGAVVTGDGFFLLSTRDECSYKVRVDNATMIRGNASDGETTIHYKKLSSTNQKLALTLGDTPSAAFDVFSTKFKETAESVLQSKWRDVTVTMPYVTSDGTQGVQWISAFTWS